jgi:hypothetical protein
MVQKSITLNTTIMVNETIDIKPTWGEQARVMIALFLNGTEEGKKVAAAELVRMAEALESYLDGPLNAGHTEEEYKAILRALEPRVHFEAESAEDVYNQAVCWRPIQDDIYSTVYMTEWDASIFEIWVFNKVTKEAFVAYHSEQLMPKSIKPFFLVVWIDPAKPDNILGVHEEGYDWLEVKHEAVPVYEDDQKAFIRSLSLNGVVKTTSTWNGIERKILITRVQ